MHILNKPKWYHFCSGCTIKHINYSTWKSFQILIHLQDTQASGLPACMATNHAAFTCGYLCAYYMNVYINVCLYVWFHVCRMYACMHAGVNIYISLTMHMYNIQNSTVQAYILYLLVTCENLHYQTSSVTAPSPPGKNLAKKAHR